MLTSPVTRSKQVTTALQGTRMEQNVCYSSAVVFSPEGAPRPSAGIWQCLQTFGLSYLGGTAIPWVEVRVAAEHPTMHKTAPHHGELTGPKRPSVPRAKDEKPRWPTGRSTFHPPRWHTKVPGTFLTLESRLQYEVSHCFLSKQLLR